MSDRVWGRSALPLLLVLALALPTRARAEGEGEESLFGKNLADLMDMSVTSVSKRPERLLDAPSAIYVITGEDIRRSGARSLAEALRLAPGVEVARINGNTWAITIRGFNDSLSNKLLVLIDGRSVYTPGFAGVYWDLQGVLLEDVDRIEVVRGPGATLWGANAVNGVINIITKSAEDTQGAFVEGGAGNELEWTAGVRYGGPAGDNGSFRVWARGFSQDGFVDSEGNDTNDDLKTAQGGFRYDWSGAGGNDLTVQGDVVSGSETLREFEPSFTFPYAVALERDSDFDTHNVLARWQHEPEGGNWDTTLQFYYDHFDRQGLRVGERRDTYDVEFQHHVQAGPRNDVVSGVGYRYTTDNVTGSTFFEFEPASDSNDVINAFVQDQIALVKDRFFVTLGTKVENNDFTGTEVQPSVRFLWTPNEETAVWASAARAVRTPSRGEESVTFGIQAFPDPMGSGLPILVQTAKVPGFDSEKLNAYEAGFRIQPNDKVTYDLALFYNDYSDLRAPIAAPPPVFDPGPPPHLVLTAPFSNGAHGDSYGGEFFIRLKPVDMWTLELGYTYLQVDYNLEGAAAQDPQAMMSSVIEAGATPQQQAYLRSRLDLPHDVFLDGALYWADRLKAFDVEDYLRLDLRLAWKPVESFEIALVGQNLLDDHHAEFGIPRGNQVPSEVERSGYVLLTWRR